jgi:hypothetical protein
MYTDIRQYMSSTSNRRHFNPQILSSKSVQTFVILKVFKVNLSVKNTPFSLLLPGVKNYRGNSSLHRNSTATSTWLEHPQERAHQARAHWQDHPELCGLGQTALMRRSSSYLARNFCSLNLFPLFLLAVFLISSYWSVRSFLIRLADFFQSAPCAKFSSVQH